jgi:hypothetical protein
MGCVGQYSGMSLDNFVGSSWLIVGRAGEREDATGRGNGEEHDGPADGVAADPTHR